METKINNTNEEWSKLRGSGESVYNTWKEMKKELRCPTGYKPCRNWDDHGPDPSKHRCVLDIDQIQCKKYPNRSTFRGTTHYTTKNCGIGKKYQGESCAEEEKVSHVDDSEIPSSSSLKGVVDNRSSPTSLRRSKRLAKKLKK